MDAKTNKPHWWPTCPYPESVFPMSVDRYPEIVPDPHVRTALSGALGRQFWELASDAIWEATKGNREDTDEELSELRDEAKAEEAAWLLLLQAVAALADTAGLDPGDWSQATEDVLLEQFDPWEALREVTAVLQDLTSSIRQMGRGDMSVGLQILRSLVAQRAGEQATVATGATETAQVYMRGD